MVEKSLRKKRGVAERVGFEPTVPLFGVQSLSRRPPSTYSAISPKRCTQLAEEVGFEPTVREAHNGFQDRRLKPLGHSSAIFTLEGLFLRINLQPLGLRDHS